MAQPSMTPEQMEKLLAYAADRLGRTPEDLVAAFRQGGFGAITDRNGQHPLSAGEAATAEELFRDREQAARLMNDPRVQELLSRIIGR